jgi:hypothetical protein
MRLTQRPLDPLGAAVAPIRPAAAHVVNYFARLSAGRFVLWCYFIWWVVVLVRYFDPSPDLWLTTLGLSVIIGLALLINTTRSGRSRVKLEPWPTFRLFLTPFCVSSFAALVKGRGFVLIFSPNPAEMLAALGICAALAVVVLAARRFRRIRPRPA